MFTTNPKLGDTDAVAEPLAILNDSSVKAERGILNNPAPLPLNIDADTGNSNVENVFTTSPSFGEIDAVAEPLLILLISNAKADSGISVSPAPLPLNTDADTPLSINTEELSSALLAPSNLNPNTGDTDAVTEPLAINDESNASSVNALLGISNKSLPLPLNTEPLCSFTSPIKSEPLSLDVTTNPFSASVDAVTEPLNINEVSKSTIAATGISNNLAPLPLKEEPLSTLTSPKNVEPLSTEVTTNPSFGSTDAVTEPELILLISKESADSGISNKLAPLPLNEPLISFASIDSDTNNEELNSALSAPKNLKPTSGSTDAVAEPLAILGESPAKFEIGILNNPLPSPVYIPSSNVTPPLTNKEPVNCEPLSNDSTLNPVSGDTDAVTEPLSKDVAISVSVANADNGISNRLAPLPE